MELGALDVEGLHLGIADGDALGVVVGVEIAVDLESGARGCSADQADEGEQAMLDLVPFAGPRRQVANADLQTQLAPAAPPPTRAAGIRRSNPRHERHRSLGSVKK